MVGKLIPKPVKQLVDRKACSINTDGTGIDLVYVEQGIEHARHGICGVVEPLNQVESFFGLVFPYPPLEQAANQTQGLQRLPKIMTCGGEKA